MSDDNKQPPNIEPIQQAPQDGYLMLPTTYLAAQREARKILDKAIRHELPHGTAVGKLMAEGDKLPAFTIDARDADIQANYPAFMVGKTRDAIPEAPERERKYWTTQYEGVNLGAVLAKRDAALMQELVQSTNDTMPPNQRAAIQSALELKYATIALKGVPIFDNLGDLELNAVLMLNAAELRALNTHQRTLLEKEGFLPQDLHLAMQPKHGVDHEGKPQTSGPSFASMGALGIPDTEGRVDLTQGPRITTTLSPKALYELSAQALNYTISHETGHSLQLKGEAYVQFVKTGVLPIILANREQSPKTHQVLRNEERRSDRYALQHSGIQSSIELHSTNYADPMPLWENEAMKYVVNGKIPEEKEAEIGLAVMNKVYTTSDYAAVDQKNAINSTHPSKLERLTRDLVEDDRLNAQAQTQRKIIARLEQATLPTSAPASGPVPTTQQPGVKPR